MRLIDADALIDIFDDRLEKIRNRYGDYSGEAGVCAGALHLIRVQPTIEPERKKGKWIHGREMAREMIRDCTTAIFYEGWTCSECGCLVEKEREPWYKYCPNCGSYNGG